MDIHQYNMFVDGEELSTLVLEDRETQAGYSVIFEFNGVVLNCDTERTHVSTSTVRARPFDNLGSTVTFVLQHDDGWHPSVNMMSPSANLHCQSGPREEIHVYVPLTWWKFEMDHDYMLYHVDAQQTCMSLRFERCRIPLHSLDPNIPGNW